MTKQMSLFHYLHYLAGAEPMVVETSPFHSNPTVGILSIKALISTN
jgi:hypothetical protein